MDDSKTLQKEIIEKKVSLRGLSSLFNLFRSVEKYETNPANTGTIGLPEPVLICG